MDIAKTDSLMETNMAIEGLISILKSSTSDDFVMDFVILSSASLDC